MKEKGGIVPQTSGFEADLNSLSASIKERQSSLLLLLEERRQRNWERPEWLMRECQYQSKENRLSRQIRSIVLKWVLRETGCSEGGQMQRWVRQFWLKVKMVMKMSLERMKALDFLNYSLFQRYQNIIDATNSGYDRALGLYLYRDVEQMVRARNRQIHQLLNKTFQTGNGLAGRNKSEYLAMTVRPAIVEGNTWKGPVIGTKKQRQHHTIEPKTKRRPFSEQSGRKRLKLNGPNTMHAKKVKKVEAKLDQFEHNLADVMDCRVDANLDKKKNIEGNIEQLFGNIMSRNTANQKNIKNYILKYQGSFLPKIRRGPLLLKKRGKAIGRGRENATTNNILMSSTLQKIAKRKFNPKKSQTTKKKRVALKNI